MYTPALSAINTVWLPATKPNDGELATMGLDAFILVFHIGVVLLSLFFSALYAVSRVLVYFLQQGGESGYRRPGWIPKDKRVGSGSKIVTGD